MCSSVWGTGGLRIGSRCLENIFCWRPAGRARDRTPAGVSRTGASSLWPFEDAVSSRATARARQRLCYRDMGHFFPRCPERLFWVVGKCGNFLNFDKSQTPLSREVAVGKLKMLRKRSEYFMKQKGVAEHFGTCKFFGGVEKNSSDFTFEDVF